MRVILFLIGIALSADGLFCGATGSMGLGEEIIVAIGVIFILWSALYDAFREKKILRFVRGIFIVGVVILTVYSVGVCTAGRQDNATGSEKYVIVPGAGLNDGEPSAMLQSRLGTAAVYLNANTSADVIVSGGQGVDEPVSEALAMYNYLVMHGIGEGRIFMEDQASSTYENFALSKDAVADGNVVIITNDFHVLRSSLMAQLNGIDATHIGAPTPWVQLPVACAREFIAQAASMRYYISR